MTQILYELKMIFLDKIGENQFNLHHQRSIYHLDQCMEKPNIKYRIVVIVPPIKA